jgi:dihydroorotase
MLQFRAKRLHLANVYPLGALTRDLQGEVLTPMVELTQAGCVGFTQAEYAISNTQSLQRAMQYAATFGYAIWLRAQDSYLGKGIVASGPLATRMGLSGVPAAAETIALHTYIDLMRMTGARVHVSKLSSAAGVDLVRSAKAEGLSLSCDVSIHNLHFTDADIGYFDTRARLTPPPAATARPRSLAAGLGRWHHRYLGVRSHTCRGDAKALPFAQAEPGATGLELLLSASLKWAAQSQVDKLRALKVITSAPATLLGLARSGWFKPWRSC